MTKIKTCFLLMLAVTLLIFTATGAVFTANADTAEPIATAQSETGDNLDGEDKENEDSGETTFDKVVEDFKAYLQNTYGADYGFYYNQIIERWGSVEAYLMQFGETLPEEYQTAWSTFVGWLGEYAPIWATALAVIMVVIIAVVGKKAFNKIVDRIVNEKLTPIVGEINAQSSAMISNLHALKALLGNNEKFKDTVKELDKAEEELADG